MTEPRAILDVIPLPDIGEPWSDELRERVRAALGQERIDATARELARIGQQQARERQTDDREGAA